MSAWDGRRSRAALAAFPVALALGGCALRNLPPDPDLRARGELYAVWKPSGFLPEERRTFGPFRTGPVRKGKITTVNGRPGQGFWSRIASGGDIRTSTRETRFTLFDTAGDSVSAICGETLVAQLEKAGRTTTVNTLSDSFGVTLIHRAGTYGGLLPAPEGKADWKLADDSLSIEDVRNLDFDSREGFVGLVFRRRGRAVAAVSRGMGDKVWLLPDMDGPGRALVAALAVAFLEREDLASKLL